MRILITDGFEKEGLERLVQEGFDVNNVKLSSDELIAQIPQYDALIVRSATKVTKEVINAAERLKIVGRAGVGVDNIDLNSANEKGIIVKFAPSGAAISVAELAMGLMIDLSRKISNSNYSLKAGKWSKDNGVELYEKTLGIIGCGRIGSEVAKKAKHGFDMNVISYDPFPKEDLGIDFVSFDDVLEKSDYITIHAPKSKYPIIGGNEINKMKKTAYLIDLSRGGNVDEKMLYESLKNSIIAGAAKDVFVKEGKNFEEEYQTDKNPLLELGNFIGTPHLGASTKEGQRRTAVEMANVISSYLKFGDSKNAVNLKKKNKREEITHNLFVTHQDVPGVFGDITTAFGKHDLNIIEQKTEYLNNGYGNTVYLLEKPVSDELINEIKAISSVYSVKK